MTTRRWALTSTEFAVLWERSGRDRLPFPLNWFATPGTAADAVREREGAARTLDTTPDDGLRGAVERLVGPAMRLHAVSVGSATARLHGGVGATSAVIAEQDPSGAVHITECSRADVPAEIARVVVVTPGTGLTLRAPHSSLARNAGTVTRSSTAPIPDREQIVALEARVRTGGGELLLGYSDNDDGLISRPRGGCRWIDVADDGRYLLTSSTDVDPILHVQPATTAAVTEAVRAMLASAVDDDPDQAPMTSAIGVPPATNS